MKNCILLICLLAPPVMAQSISDLKIDFRKVYEATEKLDFETILDLSHPKLVEMAGRAALIAEMKKAFNDANIQLSFGKTDFKPEYSEILEKNGRKFCVIRRPTIMKIGFKKPLEAAQAKIIQANIARSNSLRTVNFNSSENAFYSSGPDITVAISDAQTRNQWRFLSYEPAQAYLFETWFGKESMAMLPLPAVKPAVQSPEAEKPQENQRGEFVAVSEGAVEFKGESIPIYKAPETKREGYNAFIEGNKLSYSLFHMKNTAQEAKAIATFYKGKILFGVKVGTFEETTDVGMPAFESKNCRPNSKEGNIVKIATDNTGHHIEIFSGCLE